MISINGVPLALDHAALAASVQLSVPLDELIFAPQVHFPGGPALPVTPPARPPYKIDLAPGCLTWPQGASRFAYAQYLATEAEILAIWPNGFGADAVTLQLGGNGSGQDAIEFTLFPLILLPVSLDRSTTIPAAQQAGLYLLVLVDGRYLLQTAPPTWTITPGITTWAYLDTQIGAFLSVGYSYDAVSSAYLFPGELLAAPAHASLGVVTWAGPLLDAIGEASGRRFVANRDGTYAMQDIATARAQEAVNFYELDSFEISNDAYRRLGGLLAFPPATETTTGLFVVPDEITLVYPEKTGTPAVETGTHEVVSTFASTRTAAGYAATDVPVLEGTLRVLGGLWSDGTNHGVLDAHALQWSTDWFAWLRGQNLSIYSGCVNYVPDGLTDAIIWMVAGGDVYTAVRRGLLNPRPGGVIAGFSGVTPAPPIFPYGADFYGPVVFEGTSVTTHLSGSVEVHQSGSIDTYNVGSFLTLKGGVYTPAPAGSPITITGFLITPSGGPIDYFTSSGPLTITDIAIQADGFRLVIVNRSNYSWKLEHDAGATAARGILTWTENTVYFAPNATLELIYDGVLNRWRLVWMSDAQEHRDQHISVASSPVVLNDFVIENGSPCIRLAQGASTTYTGFAGGVRGEVHYLANDDPTDPAYAFTATLSHQNSGSSVANRFTCPGLANYTIEPGGGVVIYYDGSEWLVLASCCPGPDEYYVWISGPDKHPVKPEPVLKVPNNEKVLLRVDGPGRPEFGILNPGPSGVNTPAGQKSGFVAYALLGSPQAQQEFAGLDFTYTGTDPDQTGSMSLYSYKLGAKNINLNTTTDGYINLPLANTVNKLLGTDPSNGNVSVVGIAGNLSLSGLTLTGLQPVLQHNEIGYGSLTNLLTGSLDFTYDGNYVQQYLSTGGLNAPGGYRTWGYGSTGSAFREYAAGVAGGTVGSPTATPDSTVLARFGGYRYATGFNIAGAMQVVADATTSAYFSWISGTGPTEYMRLTAAGNLVLNNLTINNIVATDGSKNLISWSLGSGLTLTGAVLSASGSGGTVTSVGLTVPSWLTVSGSPVTGTGTLAVTATAGEPANQFLATPDGSTGAVGLRAIVAADVPTLNQNTSGNAATATALQTPRAINGVNFDGTAAITVTAAAGTLTGSTLASGVTASSLTSFGTSPALTGTPTAPTATGGTNTTQIATTAFVASAIGPFVGAVVYQGTWNANTNTPTLASSVGTKGYLYKVSVAGTTTIDGISQWNAGDSIVFDGTTWDKIDGLSTEVLSVAGKVGTVTLAASDLTNGTTGSGSVVLATSATLVTPTLGAASATTINKVTLTTPATGSTLTIADGKTLTVSNTLTLTATDGSTLAIGAGGTLGTAAYVNTGTSGGTVPLLNASNTWSVFQTFAVNVATNAVTVTNAATGGSGISVKIADDTANAIVVRDAANTLNRHYLRGDGTAVLCNGAGTLSVNTNGWISAGTSAINLFRYNNMGFSATYAGPQIGSGASNKMVFINYDPSGNTNGSFGGNEIVIPNNKAIIAPTAADTGWRHILSIDGSNVVHLGNTGSYNSHALNIDDSGYAQFASRWACNSATPQAPQVSGGTLAGVIAALVANGILSS